MNFKHERDVKRFDDLLEPLKIIVKAAELYCKANELPFTITETWTDLMEDDRLGRVSSSHREFRAVDLSSMGWTQREIDNFISWLTMSFGKYGAISKRDGVRRLVIHHNKHGDHFHIQIDRRFYLRYLKLKKKP